MSRFRLLLWLFLGLNVIDLALTIWLIESFDCCSGCEVNCIASWLLAHYGWLGVIGLKATSTGAAAWLFAFAHLRRPKTALVAISLACLILLLTIGYGAVVAYLATLP